MISTPNPFLFEKWNRGNTLVCPTRRDRVYPRGYICKHQARNRAHLVLKMYTREGISGFSHISVRRSVTDILLYVLSIILLFYYIISLFRQTYLEVMNVKTDRKIALSTIYCRPIVICTAVGTIRYFCVKE